VLRPGGRLALLEPINRFIVGGPRGGPSAVTRFSPVADIAAKVEALYDGIQDPVDDPMIDFDERDLLRLVTMAASTKWHLETAC